MIVGVIGSGAIGPDLAYGFLSALANVPGARVFLVDIKQDALDAGVKRIQGYMKKGVSRGKLSAKVAARMNDALTPTLNINDLAECTYVLEAASESLPVKKQILNALEAVVSKDTLIGFATSGLPRAWIAAEVEHPDRCFVNHPFFPAWRSLPIEVVGGDDEALTQRMNDTLKALGKVPIMTADVVCFAADDVFCNYCSEAVRIFEDGIATPAQVDAIVNGAIGGGGPFNVLDGTQGNPLVAHCQELMRDAAEDGRWFEPPKGLTRREPWRNPRGGEDASHDAATAKAVLDRILAVLFARTYYVIDNDICDPSGMNWMTRLALGFSTGILDLAAEYGAARVKEICVNYAANHPGFEVPQSILNERLVEFRGNIDVAREDDIATVTIRRPEVLNALNSRTLQELHSALQELEGDEAVTGIVLTGFGGALAGADIGELAALPGAEAAEALCNREHAIAAFMANMKTPLVAALDGPVLGGGAEISMSCHGRIAGKKLMLGQPEVNLGIIPGYGGTQRLPRLVGLDKALEMMRTGKPIQAAEACAAGWAHGEPVDDVIASARALIRSHQAGDVELCPVNEAPIEVPEHFPKVDIGHRSLTIDAILVDVVRRGLAMPLAEGLAFEAKGFGRCTQTVDMHVGMTNFMQNGPRVPAAFLNE
ncbi:MAG: enoyl-CoA hydratase-related protein [Myxococcota bacterium]|nr:enoyl-CoA hydratase-related protein [Myxococcota bacterium]